MPESEDSTGIDLEVPATAMAAVIGAVTAVLGVGIILFGLAFVYLLIKSPLPFGLAAGALVGVLATAFLLSQREPETMEMPPEEDLETVLNPWWWKQ